VAQFLKRWYGYCATGDTREHHLVVHWGRGRNGKGTKLRAIEDVLGDYAVTAPPKLLADNGRGNERHDTERMVLKGRRLVTAHEPDEGSVMREGLVKQATGGDKISGRGMRENYSEFDPTHKLQLLTNYKPEVKGQDDGIWGRILLVAYPNKYGSAEQVAAGEATHLMDTSLPEKLRAERAGIFAWLVQGALEWLRTGLNPPPSVLEASRAYQSDQDRLGRFIRERCAHDKSARSTITGGDAPLYPSYKFWCMENGYNAVGSGKFKDELLSRAGIHEVRWETGQKGSSSRRSWRGISGIRLLISSEPLPDEPPEKTSTAAPPEPAPKLETASTRATSAVPSLPSAFDDAQSATDMQPPGKIEPPAQVPPASKINGASHEAADTRTALMKSLGIGPKTADALRLAEFASFEEIAAASTEELMRALPRPTLAAAQELQRRAHNAIQGKAT